jgi:hypothetical protein
MLDNAPLRVSSAADDYLTRLVKLIPAEVVALYLTFKEVAADWLAIWATVCLVLVVIVRALGTSGANKPVQWGAVVVAAVSFVLWIYATGGHIIDVTLPAGVISAAIGLWTFVVPWFYKGD